MRCLKFYSFEIKRKNKKVSWIFASKRGVTTFFLLGIYNKKTCPGFLLYNIRFLLPVSYVSSYNIFSTRFDTFIYGTSTLYIVHCARVQYVYRAMNSFTKINYIKKWYVTGLDRRDIFGLFNRIHLLKGRRKKLLQYIVASRSNV